MGCPLSRAPYDRINSKQMIASSYSLRLLLFIVLLTPGRLLAQEKTEAASANAEEVAKKLANPVASLISVPFQNNLDVGIGENNGARNTLNVQPVIPIKLSERINLIARVILPVVAQFNITGVGTSQTGLGDALVSGFFSPAPGKSGWIWGAGPAILIPTATNDYLASKKLGIGPTALALKQKNGWTFGALANQVWSVAGDEDRPNVNQLFVQPFLNYNWKSGAGLGVNAEITENWEANTTNAYVNPTISGVTKLGKQIVSLVIGPRLHVAAPDGARANFGVRAAITLVFPK
jgi:hypothetical protein